MKNLRNSTPKKQRIQWKDGHKTWIDTFLKKIFRWLTDTWKDAQHHSLSGKYKSKSRGDTTLLLSEWLTLTTQETKDVGEDAEKGEPSCTFGGNANWCSCSGKQPSNCASRSLPKVYRSANLRGHMHPHIYSRTINTSQIMERVFMSLNWWMD